MSDGTSDGADTVTTAVTSSVTQTLPADPSKLDMFIRLIYQMPTRIMLAIMVLLVGAMWEIRPDAMIEKLFDGLTGAWLLSLKLDSTQKP